MVFSIVGLLKRLTIRDVLWGEAASVGHFKCPVSIIDDWSFSNSLFSRVPHFWAAFSLAYHWVSSVSCVMEFVLLTLMEVQWNQSH